MRDIIEVNMIWVKYFVLQINDFETKRSDCTLLHLVIDIL